MATSGRFLASARLIAVFTLGSRILGLIRECVFSYYFSTTELLSAFRIAFMAPNLARRLFGEGALSSSMVPILTETIETKGDEESRRFVGALLTVLAIVLVLGVIVVEVVIALWRAAWDDIALELAAILMPYMALICTVAVVGGVLNVRRHFATPAAAPIILNAGVIAGVLGGAVWGGLTGIKLAYALCGSVLVAGVVQLLVMGAALHRLRFFPIFGGAWRDPRVRRVLSLMAPMVIGLSAVQINSLADYIVAYMFIAVEEQRVGPAVLGYAQYLYQLPLGVFGISMATAIFPVLAQKAAAGDRAGLAEIVLRGIRLGLFVALPATVGLMFVARPLVASLFERGAFDAGDRQRVAGTLVFYSIGLTAYFAQHIVVRAFYALRDSKTPARLAIQIVGLNVAMNLALVFVLQERGLALATAVCAVIQVSVLSARLRAIVPELAWRRIGGAAARMVAATAVMTTALTVLAVGVLPGSWVQKQPVAELIVQVATGVVAYGLASRVLGVKELHAVIRRSRMLDG